MMELVVAKLPALCMDAQLETKSRLMRSDWRPRSALTWTISDRQARVLEAARQQEWNDSREKVSNFEQAAGNQPPGEDKPAHNSCVRFDF